MKTILIGNKYIGYRPITESITDFIIFCSSDFLKRDLISWRDTARHGDRFIFDADKEKRELLCIE